MLWVVKRVSKAALIGWVLAGGVPSAADLAVDSIVLQSTTSTANSGLYDAILPSFTKRTGITVHVVAVGTGQAIRNAKNGDGDVLLVHAKEAEEQFVNDGYGVERFDVMYNDFVIVGTANDPAGIEGLRDISVALSKISNAQSIFASRGDDSGTHRKELSLWKAAGIDPARWSGDWYRETGSGMGATLNTSIGMGAYTMTDRGTWISFKNKQNHRIMVEGDPKLINQYGVTLINPAVHPGVNVSGGQSFIDWLLSEDGQRSIASYRLGGKQLFFANAGK